MPRPFIASDVNQSRGSPILVRSPAFGTWFVASQNMPRIAAGSARAEGYASVELR